MSSGCRIKVNHLTLPVGASLIEATETELGYKPWGDYGNFQVTARGLGGATWALHVLIPGSPGWWKQIDTGKGENDILHIEDKFVIQGLRVTPSDAGLAASMVATICGSGRTARFSNG